MNRELRSNIWEILKPRDNEHTRMPHEVVMGGLIPLIEYVEKLECAINEMKTSLPISTFDRRAAKLPRRMIIQLPLIDGAVYGTHMDGRRISISDRRVGKGGFREASKCDWPQRRAI